MKKYMRPVTWEVRMEMSQIICASITNKGSNPPQANTNGEIKTSDASQALAKEYPHFDAWASWDDELPN